CAGDAASSALAITISPELLPIIIESGSIRLALSKIRLVMPRIRGGFSTHQRPKLALHPIHDVPPVADLLLPEQPRARIPGAVVAIQQPAPVGIEGQQNPD